MNNNTTTHHFGPLFVLSEIRADESELNIWHLIPGDKLCCGLTFILLTRLFFQSEKPAISKTAQTMTLLK